MKRIVAFGLALLGLAANAPAQTVNTIVPPASGLSEPYGVIAADNDETLYITDSANHRIVKFNAINGETTVTAGLTGVADGVDGSLAASRFFDPKGIISARGGLIVADAGNYALRFIDLGAKTVSTFAGAIGQRGVANGPKASARFVTPRGLAVAANGDIYVADLGARSIRKIDTADNVTTLTSTGLAGPSGIAIDDTGRIFVADRRGHAIKQVANDGTVTVIAGTGSAGAEDSAIGTSAAFNLPDSIVWLGSTFGLLVSDSGNHALRRVSFDTNNLVWKVETYAGLMGTPGDANGAPLAARFNLPSGLTPFSTGFLVVDDGNRSVRQVLVSSAPPQIEAPQIGYVSLIVDPTSGQLITKFNAVTDETFNNSVVVAVIGDGNASHHFTFGAGRTNILQPDPIPAPTENSPTAPEFTAGGPPSTMPTTIANPLPILSVKAFSEADERTSSPIVQSTFRFQVATPVLDLTSTPGSLTFKNNTTNAVMYFTTDGTEPSETNGVRVPDTGRLPLDISSNTTFRARGFFPNFQGSRTAILELSPTNFTPNRISLGFASGEASSEFRASPGQVFMAPVTLSLIANQKMYGLQFNLSVTNDTPTTPASDYEPRFQTFLMRPLPSGAYVPIEPQTFVRFEEITVTNDFNGTNVVTTQTVSIFSNLITQVSTDFLGVGWIERAGRTNLYNSLEHDLVTHSQPHDTHFLSSGQKVVVGTFSFKVPSTADSNSRYRVRTQRASATADGIGQDVIIESPDGTDPLTPVSANRVLEVSEVGPAYLVGDVSPFRWFNAGDFGDTNILNNDLTQLQQSLIYGLNTPPSQSDMFDALDSCCGDINHNNVASTSAFQDATTAVVNSVAFGDGALSMSDLYVSFRRAVDPGLTNYMRFWSNGVRQSVAVANLFRGLPASEAEIIKPKTAALTADPALEAEAPSATFDAGEVHGRAGEALQIPISLRITGARPVRSLMIRVSVRSLDGAAKLAETPSFTPNQIIGAPTFGGPTANGFAGAWFDLAAALPAGNYELGRLQIAIPAGTRVDAVYGIDIETAEASPNGITPLPTTIDDGLVIMEGRVLTAWSDEIPNAWRIQYFGSLMNMLSAPDADADGDGMTNLQEYRAGTNPTNAASRFAVQGEISPLAGQAFVLSWPSESGKRYRLESSTTLDAQIWTVIEEEIVGTGHLIERGIPQENGNARFYRVHIVQ